VIDEPYTLFTRIPLYAGSDGQLHADRLWAKDLMAHVGYIRRLTLCCPLVPLAEAPEGVEPLEGLNRSQVVALRRDGGWGSVLRNLVPNFRQVAAAVRASRIVHSGGAGWAFPLSFYILPLRLVRRFRWIMVIESSFWMKPATGRTSPRQWLAHHVYRVLLGACLRRADARIFTHDSYRRFFGIGTAHSLVAPAVWIDESSVIADADQAARLDRLPADAVRLLFPARLIPEKGCETILAAIGQAERRLTAGEGAGAPPITVDISGAGPLAETCRRFAEQHRGAIAVRFLEPVPYGPAWFTRLRDYHAVLLANRTEEQPRVVFDAFGQGVPILSSATDGVRDLVAEGENALLYPIDDADALAERLLAFAADPALRRRLALGTLAAVRGHSHAAMHRTRERFLHEALGL
jgi:glycosyltransferase involved in cell wall biosynthesis